MLGGFVGRMILVRGVAVNVWRGLGGLRWCFWVAACRYLSLGRGRLVGARRIGTHRGGEAQPRAGERDRTRQSARPRAHRSEEDGHAGLQEFNHDVRRERQTPWSLSQPKVSVHA